MNSLQKASIIVGIVLGIGGAGYNGVKKVDSRYVHRSDYRTDQRIQAERERAAVQQNILILQEGVDRHPENHSLRNKLEWYKGELKRVDDEIKYLREKEGL